MARPAMGLAHLVLLPLLVPLQAEGAAAMVQMVQTVDVLVPSALSADVLS